MYTKIFFINKTQLFFNSKLLKILLSSVSKLDAFQGTKMAKDVRDNERAGRAQVYIVDGENERGEKAAFDVS